MQDYLPEEHVARIVVDVVDQLDIDAFVKAYRGVGSKAWHPSMTAKADIERRAEARYQQERAEYEEKMARREARHQSPKDGLALDAPRPEGEDITPRVLMSRCLQTKAGRALYSRRKCTIEPTFGIQKAVMGYRQFLVRGHEGVTAEWDLLCLAFNLKRMFSLLRGSSEKWFALRAFIRSTRALITAILRNRR